MRNGSIGFVGLIAGMLCWPVTGMAALSLGQVGGQTFVGVASSVSAEDSGLPAAGMAGDAQDSGPFAEGTKAINELRWADAARIFAAVAEQHGEHADGALYWKAYAEDKLGQSKPSQQTCAMLRKDYPASKWIEDCGALEVEIRAKTGKRVEIEPGQSDDVKLLALNAMMRQDEPRALAEIQEILNGDSSEKLKKEAQFILGTHYSNTTYAQIVRISYLEGDVRIERGEASAKANGEPWEKAVANLPLETGFSLATGNGRAEIEFENASTLYLGENSVLTFNDLHATAGIPYTELALLSGTVTLHIHPYVVGEDFILHTPTNDLESRYPDRTYARIESFSDGIAVTPLERGALHLSGIAKEAIEPGRTFTYLAGQLWPEEAAADPPASAAAGAWDKWVGDRVTQREAAIASVIKASGLPEPIPGMAEMAGQGRFFVCAPYGTCWEPESVAVEDEEADVRRPGGRIRPVRGGGGAHMVHASYGVQASSEQAARSGNATQPRLVEESFDFPCMPGSLRYRAFKDPVTGRQTVMDVGMGSAQAYDWAVCHAGSWIRHRKHYVWVGSCKRHHVDPVRWVKSGHTVAFVPLHPYDVKGQPAINARHEVFEVTGKGEVTVHPVKFEPNLPIEYLKEAPKEYRAALLRPLVHVETPRMAARVLGKGAEGKGVAMGKTTVPIHFDARSRSFTMPREETRGGRTTTSFAPITNHTGSLQARAGSFGGASGFHGGSGGSSPHGGGSSGSSHTGGSSSSGGGGGGSHSSGTASASSSSASASSSSGGGSHH